ncbi:hypothetical protein BDR04DRAFT_1008642, partial [Suillus decipiens]
IKPITTTMLAHAQIIHCFPEDPLLSLPTVSPNPPDFVSGIHLTTECINNLGIFQNSFLWPEE